MLVLSMPLDVLFVMVSSTEKKKSKMRFCPNFWLVWYSSNFAEAAPRQSLEFNSISSSCNRKIISKLTPSGTNTHTKKSFAKRYMLGDTEKCIYIYIYMCNKYAREIIANHDSEIFLKQIWTFFHSGQDTKEYLLCVPRDKFFSLFALRFS